MIPKIWESDMFEWDGAILEGASPQGVAKATSPDLDGRRPASFLRTGSTKRDRCDGVRSGGPRGISAIRQKYREDIKKAEPVGQFVTNQWQTSIIAYCGEDDREAKELCTRSLKTFFGPGKPYLQDQKDVYQKLLQQWGGVPDHLKLNFSRYIREVEDEATGEVKEALDLSGGAAREAVAQLDGRYSVRAWGHCCGRPGELYQGHQASRGGGDRPSPSSDCHREGTAREGDEVHRNVREVRNSRVQKSEAAVPTAD